jgi:hypothetical protein
MLMSSLPEKMKFMNRAAVGLWKIIYAPLFRRAARQILKGRLFDLDAPQKGRWLESDIRDCLNQTWTRTDSLMPIARLEELPTLGSRHNVFLAVVTTAAYQVLLERGVPSDYTKTLVADVGWKIYSWMFAIVSIPFRIVVRDPGVRMEKILRTIMIFPFSAPGAPGYEVKVWTEGSDTHTHWTHCPPHTFVRRLIDTKGDRGELNAFHDSWCLYDWPGADILANDGRHGHYSRPHTLSKGDSVCDMCWHGRAKIEDTRTD